MAACAVYGDRDGVRTNMYGQRNWHIAHPLCRSVADRLIRIMVMLFPAPCGVKSILAGNRTFVNFCLQKNVRMNAPRVPDNRNTGSILYTQAFPSGEGGPGAARAG